MVSNNPLIVIIILITYDDANDENNNDYRISTHDKKKVTGIRKLAAIVEIDYQCCKQILIFKLEYLCCAYMDINVLIWNIVMPLKTIHKKCLLLPNKKNV